MIVQKRTVYSFILLLAALMLAMLAAVLCLQPKQSALDGILFREESTGLRLRPVYDPESETHVLYLPESWESMEASLWGSLLYLQGEDGSDQWARTDGLLTGQRLTVKAYSLFGIEEAELELRRCSGLPSLFLETQSDTLDKLHESKNNQTGALAVLLDEADMPVFSQACTVRGRGNSSWDNQAKRPYELDFDSGVTFGPFEDISRLCLLAEYSDESKLRNDVAYYGAQLLEIPYASGYTYVNLYFGGKYLGLYGIATKEEYRKDLSTGQIHGVFEVTSNLEKQDFMPSLGRNPVRVLYGDVAAVRSAVAEFEEALVAKDWAQCSEIIDPDSFARKYVMEELFANSDMTYASQYFYLGRDGKIRCMLPWDYDLSLGYAFRYYNNKQVWEMESYKDLDGWYAMLAEFPQFRESVLQVLEAQCTPAFAQALGDRLMTSAQKIAASRECDLYRWENAVPFNWFDRSCSEDTLLGMAKLYSGYFPQRIAYLKDHFRNWEDYCLVAFEGVQYGNLCIPRGEKLWDYLEGARILQGEKIDSRFTGWYTEDGLTPEEVDIVTENIVFHAQYG